MREVEDESRLGEPPSLLAEVRPTVNPGQISVSWFSSNSSGAPPVKSKTNTALLQSHTIDKGAKLT